MTALRGDHASEGRRFLEGFAARLEEQPDRPFVHYYSDAATCRTVTFGDLRSLLAAPFSALIEQARPDDLLFILNPDPLEQITWWLAALYAGVTPGILTPLTPKLDPRKYFSDLETLLREYANARLVLASPASLEIGNIPKERLISLSQSRSPLRIRPPSGKAPLIFQQSSGTTGIRKGVVLSEGAVVRQLDSYARAIDLAETDVIVSWLPLYHDMGLVACLMQAVYAGTPLVLTSPLVWLERPAWLFEAVHRHRGTLCWLPNFAFNVLADRVRPTDLPGDGLRSLRLATSCSERVVPDSIERFQHTFAANGMRPEAVASCYALAENTFAATQSKPGGGVKIERIDRARLETASLAALDPNGVAVASSGAPMRNVSVRVMDGDVVLEDGKIGDIQLQSDCAFAGYFGIGASTNPFSADGWYRTGDYGYQREGELFVLGRRNDIIIRAGRNVDPADIERALDDMPRLKPGRSVALGQFNDTEGTEDIVVLAEFAAERVDDLGEIARQVQDKLATTVGITVQRVEIMRPGWLVKSSSGKVSRAACLKKYEATQEKRRATSCLEVITHSDGIGESDKDSFQVFGAHSKIRTPTMVTSPGLIQIGNWVSLGRNGKILMQTDFSFSKTLIEQHYPHVTHHFDPKIFGRRDPVLKIGDGTSIGDGFFISCANRIEIGRHVMFSDRVFISDSNHLYDNPDLPISLQSNDLGKPIIIEDHSWIGINVVILEGVRVGRHSIISAGSVVTHDVPPYSVVAGNPARVVKSIAPNEDGARTASTEAPRPGPPPSDLMAAISSYLSKELGRRIDPEDSLFRAGIIDSLATLRLFVFLENELGVRIDETRFMRERPDSIAALCGLIR